MPAVQVGVRELKNRLTSYLKLAKADKEVIVTERGRPIAVIQPLGAAGAPRSLEARIAALAARGEISAPERRLTRHIPRVRIAGPPLSAEIIADRR
ncbi:MAG: type II toxin-antitoxin system prevent-host-death family antitoxin [Candidatus Binataceae bacterium]